MKDIYKRLGLEEKSFKESFLVDVKKSIKENGYEKVSPELYDNHHLEFGSQPISIDDLTFENLEEIEFLVLGGIFLNDMSSMSYILLKSNFDIARRATILALEEAQTFHDYFWILEWTVQDFSKENGDLLDEIIDVFELTIPVLESKAETLHEFNKISKLLSSYDKIHAKELYLKSVSLAKTSKEFEFIAKEIKYYHKDKEFSDKLHFKAMELAKTSTDYAYLGNWKTATELAKDGDDFNYLLFISYQGPYLDTEALEMLDMIVEYLNTHYTSDFIAEIANNIFEDAENFFPCDPGYGADDGVLDMIETWTVRLYRLAIKKSTSKEDDEYINELLSYRDESIQTYLLDALN